MNRLRQGTEGEATWRELTWAAVEDWAGLRSVERGREYCRAGRVSRLALTEEGDVVGWVRGGGRYVCRVRCDKGGLRGRCTCPYDGPGCKHAVAAVLAYLDALRRGREVSPAEEGDALWPFPDLDVQGAPTVLPDDAGQLRQQIDAALVCPLPTVCESVMPHLRKLRSLL